MTPAGPVVFAVPRSVVSGGIAVLLLSLLACSESIEPTRVQSFHIQGRVFDIDTNLGIEGVAVRMVWSAGAFGQGGSHSVTSDAQGSYDLIVDFQTQFGTPALCTPDGFGLALVVPRGYVLVPNAKPIECTPNAQVHQLALRHTGS
jgi:hypothetical protein